MPTLHESNDDWIYESLIDDKFKYDPEAKIYKYTNDKYPNKNYKKTFNPKEFMTRGDVINFGGDYRNENKMIFDGYRLHSLWTDVDDYGSVPPDFVAGDGLDEFNIGDFEDLIDHNCVNWLSKQKLQEIELYENDTQIWGKVTIRGKLWNIYFNTNVYSDFSEEILFTIRTFNYVIEDDTMIITTATNNKYIIKPLNKDVILKNIFENNKISIVLHKSKWFAFSIIHEIPLRNNLLNGVIQYPNNFPAIWKNLYYNKEDYIVNKDEFDKKIVRDSGSLDRVTILEINSYPIKIERMKDISTNLINKIRKGLDDQILHFNDYLKRIAFNREGPNVLYAYMNIGAV